jgi:glyoxylase-like metal-dependent hydrolase (beta-lactamase superfamily II)
MNRLSADQIEALGRGPIDDELRLRPFEVDILLRHGEEFNLGGLTCRVHETPGHTRDSLAFFFPEIGALFPGDAGGVLRDRPLDKIQPAFVASYQAYVDSLRSMIALNPKIICPAHGWVLTHDDATGFLRDSLATTLAYRELIENILDAAGGDVEEAIQRLAQIEYEGAADRGEPVSAYVTNLTAQVKHIAGQRSHKRDNGSRSAGE